MANGKTIFTSILTSILASAALLAVPLLATTTAAAAAEQKNEQDTGRVVAVLQSVADEWNKSHTTSAAYFEAETIVIDSVPPYLFQGPESIHNWIKAYRDSQPAEAKDAQTSLHFLQPKDVEINGAHAYIAVPAEWTVTMGGHSDVSHGIVTASLNKSAESWRIAAWTWAPQ